MRERLLRRSALAAAGCAATAAFTGSLVGIATTEGKLPPDGVAAGVAAKQREERAREHRCPLPQRTLDGDAAL